MSTVITCKYLLFLFNRRSDDVVCLTVHGVPLITRNFTVHQLCDTDLRDARHVFRIIFKRYLLLTSGGNFHSCNALKLLTRVLKRPPPAIAQSIPLWHCDGVICGLIQCRCQPHQSPKDERTVIGYGLAGNSLE